MSSEVVPVEDVELLDAPEVHVDHPMFKAPVNLNPAQRRRIIEHRREKVSQLALRGYTESKIAEVLGVGSTTIHNDLVALRRQWRDASVQNIEDAASLDLARIEFAIAGVMPRVVVGDDDAIITMLRCLQQKGRILGYGMGVRVDVETYLRSFAEAQGLDPDRASEIGMRLSLTLT